MISNTRLDSLARKYEVEDYRGTLCKDELPNPVEPGRYIVNMQDAYNSRGKPNPGTHWCMLDVEPTRSIWIDAFGVVPPLEVVERAAHPIYYNVKQIEDINSNLCGWYALYMLVQKTRGRSYQQALDDFKTFPHTAENRYVIDDFFGIRSK
jgi:hypothetical protein